MPRPTKAQEERMKRARKRIDVLTGQGYRLNERAASPYYKARLDEIDPLRTKGRKYPKPKQK